MNIKCKKCGSPINRAKAERRYTKKYGNEPSKSLGIIGLCACGEWVSED